MRQQQPKQTYFQDDVLVVVCWEKRLRVGLFAAIKRLRLVVVSLEAAGVAFEEDVVGWSEFCSIFCFRIYSFANERCDLHVVFN